MGKQVGTGGGGGRYCGTYIGREFIRILAMKAAFFKVTKCIIISVHPISNLL